MHHGDLGEVVDVDDATMNSASARTINPKTMRGPFCEWAEVPDTAYDDGKLTVSSITA